MKSFYDIRKNSVTRLSCLLCPITFYINNPERSIDSSIAAQWEWQRPIDLFHRVSCGRERSVRADHVATSRLVVRLMLSAMDEPDLGELPCIRLAKKTPTC